MPFTGVSAMDRKREFVRLALAEGVNRRELCRRYGVSPTLGYRLLARYLAEGETALISHEVDAYADRHKLLLNDADRADLARKMMRAAFRPSVARSKSADGRSPVGRLCSRTRRQSPA